MHNLHIKKTCVSVNDTRMIGNCTIDYNKNKSILQKNN
jgi:hypothetical protein